MDGERIPHSPTEREDRGIVYPVTLGRDAETRAFRESDGQKQFQCVCCGQYTLNSADACAVCSQCGWEDWYECHDEPAATIRPNNISLEAARSLVQRFGPGACCEANWRGGMKRIPEIETMTPDELATLKTAQNRVQQH